MAAVTGDNRGVYVRCNGRRYGYYGYCCGRGVSAAAVGAIRALLRA